MVNNEINFLGLSHDLWQFKHGLYSIAFLTAGGLYWQYEDNIKRLMKKWVIAFMIIAYIIIFSTWADDVDVLVSILTLNWMGYIAGCFASILVIELCKYLSRINILTFIGQNSISFYFMSGALPIVMSMIVNRVIGSPTWYGLMAVLLLSITIAYVATNIFNRYIPWIFDLRRINSTHSIS